jgi:hypothetical protein
MDAMEGGFVGACDACGATQGPLVKMSLGKDFFGRAYDRLSPSFDQSPKWYCELCSMHKNLQRDFRDIRHEFDKLNAGHASELLATDQVQRAYLRLREIMALIDGRMSSSTLLNTTDVNQLLGHLQRIQNQPGFPSLAG